MKYRKICVHIEKKREIVLCEKSKIWCVFWDLFIQKLQPIITSTCLRSIWTVKHLCECKSGYALMQKKKKKSLRLHSIPVFITMCLCLCFPLSRYPREVPFYSIAILHQWWNHLAPDGWILLPSNYQHTFH